MKKNVYFAVIALGMITAGIVTFSVQKFKNKFAVKTEIETIQSTNTPPEERFQAAIQIANRSNENETNQLLSELARLMESEAPFDKETAILIAMNSNAPQAVSTLKNLAQNSNERVSERALFALSSKQSETKKKTLVELISIFKSKKDALKETIALAATLRYPLTEEERSLHIKRLLEFSTISNLGSKSFEYAIKFASESKIVWEKFKKTDFKNEQNIPTLRIGFESFSHRKDFEPWIKSWMLSPQFQIITSQFVQKKESIHQEIFYQSLLSAIATTCSSQMALLLNNWYEATASLENQNLKNALSVVVTETGKKEVWTWANQKAKTDLALSKSLSNFRSIASAGSRCVER